MPQAAIFNIDGTLVESVDLHASAWHEALVKFGHDVTFKQARSQIGRDGDQLSPVFFSEAEQKDHGEVAEEWRGRLFKSKYLPLVRPFSAVPQLSRRVHEAGLKVAAASSAKKSELEVYLEIAGIRDLVNVATPSEDAEQSKPSPDLFQVALKKLGIEGSETVIHPRTLMRLAKPAFSPSVCYAATLPKPTSARAVAASPVYPGPAAWLFCFGSSPLPQSNVTPQEA
jgi:phosphoglycolate phosphatase-like HAD superfamily hydrolase